MGSIVSADIIPFPRPEIMADREAVTPDTRPPRPWWEAVENVVLMTLAITLTALIWWSHLISLRNMVASLAGFPL